ncbi:MAG: hypothetical protein V4592_04870 [Bacteroidota bacterium]
MQLKKLLLPLLILFVSNLFAQTAPTFNGKPLVDVTTISAWNFSARPAGWYRIAKSTSGYRANATFELRDNAAHSTLRFEVGANFNTTAATSFTVTSHSYFGGPAIFQKVRLLTGSTYDDEFLEVYVDPHYNDNQAFYAYLINAFADGDWTLINWTSGVVPSGYISTEFSTDILFTVGNMPSGNIFTVARNGYVGINTTTPQEALSVNGKIRSKEVKVEAINWPDYVFKKDYHLPSLSSIKTYIDQNYHLPDMPSEQDVAKDGVNLGEMNKLLLKKVEELTLYLIEKDKKEQAQEQKLNILQERIEKLTHQIGEMPAIK